VSVGIEHIDDIIEDFVDALATITVKAPADANAKDATADVANGITTLEV